MPYRLATASQAPARPAQIVVQVRRGEDRHSSGRQLGQSMEQLLGAPAQRRQRAGALARRTRPAEHLGQARPDPFAAHLDQAETRHRKYLHRRRVIGHGLAQRREHARARRPRRQIDEVDHDRAADPAQAQLPGDLTGCGEVGLERLPAAAVDVDGGQRRGRLDDERAAAGERHARLQRLLELLLRAGRLEGVGDAGQALGHARLPFGQPGARPHEARPIADHDALEVRRDALEQQTVQRVIHPMDARRRDRRARRGLDPRPAVPQPGQLRDQLRVARDRRRAPQRDAGVGEQCLRPRPLLGRRRGALEPRRQRDAAPTRPIDEIRPTSAMSPVTRGALPAAGPWRTWTRTPCPSLTMRSIGASRPAPARWRASRAPRKASAANPQSTKAAPRSRSTLRTRPSTMSPRGSAASVVQLVDLEEPPVLEQPGPEPERRALDDQLAAHGSLRQPRPAAGRAWSRAAGRRRSSSCR